jgi:hypothetical protein
MNNQLEIVPSSNFSAIALHHSATLFALSANPSNTTIGPPVPKIRLPATFEA